MTTARPWTAQTEPRVLVRGRATALLERNPSKPKPLPAAKIDQLNQA